MVHFTAALYTQSRRVSAAQSLAVVGQPVVDLVSDVWCNELAVIDDGGQWNTLKAMLSPKELLGLMPSSS